MAGINLEVIDAFLANTYFVYLAYGISKTRQISDEEIEAVDNMKTIAGIFGLRIPYRMTRTEIVHMRYTDPALVTLAWQIQNIIRFHKDADKYWKELKAIKLPGNWDRLTVQAAHTKILELEKKFHLNPVTMVPESRYYAENYIHLDAFRVEAMKLGISEFAVFRSVDDLYSTSFPRNSIRNPAREIAKSYVGGTVKFFRLNDMNAANYLSKPGIVVAR